MNADFNIDAYLATGVAAKYAQGLLAPEEAALFEEKFGLYPQLRNALLAEQLALVQRRLYSKPMPENSIWKKVAASIRKQKL